MFKCLALSDQGYQDGQMYVTVGVIMVGVAVTGLIGYMVYTVVRDRRRR